MEEVSTAGRIKLFKAQPLFTNINETPLTVLSQCADEIHLPAGSVLVQEGDLVDSFYLIIAGKLIVTTQAEEETSTPQILATLTKSQSIGLDKSGFYSKSGLRTATVSTLTPTYLLRIQLTDFQRWLKTFPEAIKKIEEFTDLMIRSAFIKQALPFRDLTPSQTIELAEKVTEIILPAGSTIFNQGDQADNCYLLQEGEIDILITDRNEEEHLIAKLEPPAILGETGIIMDSPRNATAITVTPCKLLVLSDNLIKSVIENTQSALSMFTTIMMERSRPLRKDNIIVQEQRTKTKELIYILMNPETDTYMKLSEPAWYIWQHLNGLNTIRDLTLKLQEKYKQFTPKAISKLIYQLAQAKFVSIEGLNIPSAEPEQTNGIMSYVTKMFEANYVFKSADAWISRIYPYIKWFFNKQSLILMTLIIGIGFLCFLIAIPKELKLLFSTKFTHASILFLSIAVLSLPFILLHELAHALTTKHYNKKVKSMGLGWYWIGPVFFVDTSEMWLAPRWHRIAVNASGPMVNAVIAGFFSIIALFANNLWLTLFCWLFALSEYISALRTLSPILENDGQYILADVLDDASIQTNSLIWISEVLPHEGLRAFSKDYKNEIIFWAVSFSYLLIGIFVLFIIQHYILIKLFPLSDLSIWIRIIIFLLVVSIALVSTKIRINKKIKLLGK